MNTSKSFANKLSDDIVIEVRGGCVVAVYTNNEATKVILIDWDNESVTENEFQKGCFLPKEIMNSMPEDTKLLYKRTYPIESANELENLFKVQESITNS